jgi:hypothetical protein
LILAFQSLSILGGEGVVRERDGDVAVDVTEEQKKSGTASRLLVGRNPDFTQGTGEMTNKLEK